MDDQLARFEEVHDFVCPPEFWPAMGYTGDARYVAIWWEQCGDEASWSDGRSSVVGAELSAYMELLGHNIPPGHPLRWRLGSSEDAAEFRLIIDRETERVWVVPYDEVTVLLKSQWPAVDDSLGVVAFEDFETWIAALIANRPDERAVADIERSMKESAERYEALVAALARRAKVV